MKSTKKLLIAASIVTGVALGSKTVHAQQLLDSKISKTDIYNYNDYSKVSIKLGTKGDIVKNVQGALNLYFGTGLSEDGIYGKYTEDAVKSVQKKLGICTDGIFGPKTAKALLDYVNKASLNDDSKFSSVSVNARKNIESSVTLGKETVDSQQVKTTKVSKTTIYNYNDYFNVNIKLNEKGDIVKNIQGVLNSYFGVKLSEDGIYGKRTEDAVKSVQKKLGISADGVFGPKTAKAFLDYINNNYYNSVDNNNGFSPISLDIQKKLISLGYNLKLDGNLNSYDTISAIKQFQKENSLTINGKMDTNSANRLYKEDKVKADETAEFKSDTDYYILVSSLDHIGKVYQEINDKWKEIKRFDILSGKVNKGDYKSGLQGKYAKFNEVEMRNFTQIDGLNVFYSAEKESGYGLKILDENAKFLSGIPYKTTIKVF